MTEKELQSNYTPEVYEACKGMTNEIRKFNLQQKNSLSAEMQTMFKNRCLKGPIAASDAVGQDAVLLGGMQNLQVPSIQSVRVILVNPKGEYEESNVSYNFGLYRNFSGNHVVIINSSSGVGIYEDSIKNRKNPLKESYEKKVKKAGISMKIHFLLQLIFWALDVFILGIVFEYFEVFELRIIRFILNMLVSCVYLILLKLMEAYYTKKYGKDIFDNTFKQVGYSFFALSIYFSFKLS